MKPATCCARKSISGSRFAVLAVVGVFTGCAGVGPLQLPTQAKPDSASPAAASSASQRANASADKAAYKPVEYANAAKPGPQIVVIPGTMKTSNAAFTQRYQPNNIADFAELELTRANFNVMERSNLKSVEREFELAYNMGDRKAAQRILQSNKMKPTRWIVGFDILKAEPVATAKQRFDGATAGKIFKTLTGGKDGDVGDTAIGSIQSEASAGVWLVGMRYKVIDATTTEQVATGYKEQKMEVGATSGSFLGVSNADSGGATLDTLVLQLVQLSVSEIDSHYK
jgi:predicted small lipoprotein YifL